MFHRAVTVEYLEGTVLEVTFRDGIVKRFDVSALFDELPQLRALEDYSLFSKGKLLGGYGIIWNSEIDLSIEEIYSEGTIVRKERPLPGIAAGDAVIKARAKRDISQKKLSSLCGIDQADISRIERGIANPSMDTLSRIADALGCELRVELLPKEDKE